MNLLLSLLPHALPRVIQDHDKALYPATSVPEDAMVTPPKSVLDQLPAEIMGEIFLQCLPHPDYFVRPRKSYAPMVLCSVSRHWREVAFSTPALWSSISVLFLNGRLKPNALLVQSWLDRSSQHPLSIELVVEEHIHAVLGAERFEILTNVLQIFIPAYKRWRRIRFHLCNNAHIAFASFPDDGIPLLEYLDINVNLRSEAEIDDGGSAGPFPGYLQNLFHDSPLLRRLICKGMYVKAPSAYNISIRALTKLILDCQLAISECLLILSMCPKLETCTFHKVSKLSLPGHPLPPSEMVSRYNNLRHLRVETGTPIPTLFQSLTLTSLESLTVLSTTQELLRDPIGAQEISSMIMRSSPPLKALTLENIPFIEENMIQLLHSLDSLLILDLNDEGSVGPSRLTDKIVLALAGKRYIDEGTFLCPKLQVLKLCGSVTTSDGVFAEMITLRLKAATSGLGGVARLKAVHVEFGEVPQYSTSSFMRNGGRPLDFENLKKLRVDGLNVRFFVK